MTKPEFTPGPWRWVLELRTQDGENMGSGIEGPDGQPVIWQHGIGIDMHGDDYNLVVAAPELYNELESALTIYREAGYHKEADALERLLAKARGEG